MKQEQNKILPWILFIIACIVGGYLYVQGQSNVDKYYQELKKAEELKIRLENQYIQYHIQKEQSDSIRKIYAHYLKEADEELEKTLDETLQLTTKPVTDVPTDERVKILEELYREVSFDIDTTAAQL